MRVISSALTTFHKRVVPVLWAGVLAVLLATSIASREPAAIVMAGVGLAVIGGLALVILKRLVWDLADEVQDYGDYLVVRRGDEEERIPLANIVKVDGTRFVNPPRVTLCVAPATRFGEEIAFMPVMKFKFNPVAKDAIVTELSGRVDLARARRVS